MSNGVKVKVGIYKFDKKTGKVKIRKALKILTKQEDKDMKDKANRKKEDSKNVNK